MNRSKITTAALIASLALSGSAFAQQQNLNQLLQSARQESAARQAEINQRVQEFQQRASRQQQLLAQARSQVAAQQARSNSLKARFDANEAELSELTDTLTVRLGNLGELLGVVRQVSGDVKGVIDGSLVSVQYPDRTELISQLAQMKAGTLPTIEQVNELRVLMLGEMIESGNVALFPATIVDRDGVRGEAEVVRVGVFNAITGNKFLRTATEGGRLTLQELVRQPQSRYRKLAKRTFEASGEGGWTTMAIDPTSGSLLGLLIQKPSFIERIKQGGFVGYVIIALGILGVLLALERWGYLAMAGNKIKGQMKSSTPKANNALGRILGVYHENRDVDTETLELKLDEAILKETPQLEKRLGTIKVLAAVAPLLGLLGTVTGMIETFQSITLFGTGDPKLMAGGISEALMTTLMGLTVAIPLVLLHSVLAARSKALIEILEEQSAGIIAKHAERE